MRRTPLLISLIFLFLVHLSQAQEHQPAASSPSDSVKEVAMHSTKQIDLVDVVRGISGKSKSKKIRQDTITAKPVYSFIPAVGYTLSSGFALSLSGNIQFRRDSLARISTITASAAISSKKQFTLPIESSIWLKGNKYLLVGDYRFYEYPQSTFGLGSSSHVINEDPMKFMYVRFYQTFMRHIKGDLYLGAGYIIDYHGNITEQGTKSGNLSDYAFYGETTHTTSSGVTLNALYDSRDNAVSPLKGMYTAVQYRDSYRFLGSSQGWRSLIVDYRKYINFPRGSDNVIALWNYDWVTLNGRPPYLDLPANGWDPYSSTGRGYIQGRFRGAQMFYAEAAYRFRITNNGLFGGVIFANAETLSAQPGTRLQAIQPGFGPGLRIKLNKVSKTNVCIDYGFGREGSRGLFVNVGELF